MYYYALFLMILCFPFQFYAETPLEVPKLVVNGSATINSPADEVRLSIGVVTENKKADIALRANGDQMNAMMEVLKSLELSPKEYRTQHFFIEPVYSIMPKNPPADWKSEIIGYKVENKIEIKTMQLDLIPQIIDRASAAGANSVDLLEFGLHDPQTLHAEAIEAAVKNTVSQAEALAKAAGLRLKRILEINLENIQGGKRRLEQRFFAAKAMPMAYESSSPIESGDVEMSASVKLIYEIEPISK
jgi:uncharacterized protein